MATNSLGSSSAGRARSLDIDAELRELRMRMSRVPQHQQPTPPITAPAAGTSSRASSNTAAKPEDWSQRAVSVLQFLTNAAPKPSASTPDFAEGYVKAAAQDFVSETVEINAFQYSEEEEVERKLRDQITRVAAGAAPVSQLPRFTAEPFLWVRAPSLVAVSQLGTPQPQTVDWSPAPTPAGAAVLPKTSIGRAPLRPVVATASTTVARSGNDPYALPEDIASRHRLSKDDVLRNAKSLRSTSTPAPSSSPAVVPRALTADHTTRRLMQYKDPALVVKVDDGRIAFCRECHRLVLGHGRGRCPHCGAVNDDDVNNDEEEEPKSIAAIQAAPVEVTPRQLGPYATVEEIEAEEQRLFQAAVAAWRGGAAVITDAPTSTETHPAVAANESAKFHTSLARASRHVARRGVSAVYFSHLWGCAFPPDQQRHSSAAAQEV